jgi:hypothetical protein
MGETVIEDRFNMYYQVAERYAHFFDRPDSRLRFLNHTLAQQSASITRLHPTLERYPFIERSKLFRWLLDVRFHYLVLKELRPVLLSTPRHRRQLWRINGVPFGARLLFQLYQARRIVCCAVVVTLAATLFCLYAVIVNSVQRVNAYLIEHYRMYGQTKPAVSASNPTPTQGTDDLPDYKAERVWQVETKDDYERYSNGGRILKDYETSSYQRTYYVLQPGTYAANDQPQHNPVGIVYHTSESDLVPFTSENNGSIEEHTRGLLQYVKENRSYNYVIDRFGQIYRIVPDDQAANHAGNSVWADQKGIYAGLNESFIGVCFETNSQAGSLDEQLTEAQILSGRLLTQILRSRYNIDDANCVTHALVSINPAQMLICYHRDWVRNFPFAAMGLSDKYQVAPASMRDFGFTYDGELLNLLGGQVWPGARLAEEEFRQRSEHMNEKAEQVRRRMRDLYFELTESQRQARTLKSPDASQSE